MTSRTASKPRSSWKSGGRYAKTIPAPNKSVDIARTFCALQYRLIYVTYIMFHNEKSRCTPLSGLLFVRRQILLSPSYFSLSPCKFSLSYKIFFVTNFVTRITKFVTCVRKFVTYITKFVTNFFCADSKKYQAESKKYHGGKKNYLRDSSGGHG